MCFQSVREGLDLLAQLIAGLQGPVLTGLQGVGQFDNVGRGEGVWLT